MSINKNFILIISASFVIITAITVLGMNANNLTRNSRGSLSRELDTTQPKVEFDESIVRSGLLRDERRVSVVVQGERDETQNGNGGAPVSNSTMSDTNFDSISSSGESTSEEQGKSEFAVILILEESVTLAAVSLRMVYNLDMGIINEDNVTVTPSSILTSANWTYPVNSVYKSDNSIYIDLALLNLSTTGYEVDGEITLATVDLGDKTAQPTDFTFDPSETKVITKEGKELTLDFVLE